jgi:hypothetical protein
MTLQKRILSIFLLFFLIAFQLRAQVIQIKWTDPVLVQDTTFKTVETMYFLGAKTAKDLLPHYELRLQNVAAENFRLINTHYQPLTEKEIALVQNKSIPGSTIKVHLQNGQPLTVFSFVPIRLNSQSGTYEKLISFSYQYDRADFSIGQHTTKHSANKKHHNAKTSTTAAATGSVLAVGTWYKISISKTGLHKIDYDFLKSMGINPDQIDPTTIKIFGNGFGMLPQYNLAARPDDLMENSIMVKGEGDGQFNQGDYILFYGKGPDTWTYNNSENIFNHAKNIYTDKSCYFLTFGSIPGLRITNINSPGVVPQIIRHFDDHAFHENDLRNHLSSGKEWYGETFDADNLSNTFKFKMPGLFQDSTIKLTSSVLARSTVSSSFDVYLGNGSSNTLLGGHSLGASNQFAYDAIGEANRKVFSAVIGNPSTVYVTLNYHLGASALSVGELNYLELNVKRKLALYGNQTHFRTLASTAAANTYYKINNAKNGSVWQVTDITSIINIIPDSVSGDTAMFSASSGALEEFIVFEGNDFPAPDIVGKVEPQNLHGIVPNLPDLVIVTFPEFLSAANQLAHFRRTHDKLDVVVTTTSEVYNEFSSGAQDISAIRDFMKMLFDRKTSSDSVRYLLLFGDCSYDYKGRISGNTNFVPVYQSYESLLPLSSYSSDDYFGLLDDTDGDWGENPADDEYLDIGIGRLPVKSIEEADAVVAKLIHYSSDPACLGKWRNSITFMSDDGDGNLHVGDANDLATIIDTTYKIFNINKVFLDAFPQLPTPGGEKAPEVNARIDQDVNNGTFILNYSGHGGETGLAQEAILDIPQIEAWQNYNNMPFMITATCDFGRYDDPARTSGAEIALIRAEGGAIGLISSTRVVYAFSNKDLNLAIYNYIFQPLSDGQMPRLGDVIRQSKNASVVDVNNRNYALLGDPSLQLAYPKHTIVLTKINTDSVFSGADTLRALSKVFIQGEVRNSSNALLNTFSGKLNITVYDKKTSVSTYGTQGDPVFTFGLRNNALFDGNASVKNGKWSISFVVPKDISYQYDFGKISMYAEKTGTMADAGSYYSNIIIGGTDLNAPSDNLPPRIKMFMNDESFIFGGLTDKDALFIAKLSDENGINTSTSGIGHEIAATLDNADKPTVLNSFYTATLNDYKHGTVKYPYVDLAPGHHSIKLKVWDTYNNSSESYLEFVVANDEKIALSHILNYPNPFSTHTVFHFDHNRAGEELDVMVQIYTVSGKLVKTLDSKIFSSSAHFSGLDWDGKDDFGDKIGKGVYVYRVWVRTPRDGSSVHKYEKLVILN